MSGLHALRRAIKVKWYSINIYTRILSEEVLERTWTL